MKESTPSNPASESRQLHGQAKQISSWISAPSLRFCDLSMIADRSFVSSVAGAHTPLNYCLAVGCVLVKRRLLAGGGERQTPASNSTTRRQFKFGSAFRRTVANVSGCDARRPSQGRKRQASQHPARALRRCSLPCLVQQKKTSDPVTKKYLGRRCV